ncbi:MAG: ABC transporter permease, partial [Phycisphaerales bacterium]|nr:ABC transporter permease [Phycisphaerales bacterium]
METLFHDIRYGIRMLARNRSTTFFAVLALALGIGANSAIFSVFNAVLLRPMPYEDPERLVFIYGTLVRDQVERRSASYPDFEDWRDRSRVFEGVAAVDGPSFTLTGFETPERIQGELVSHNYFATLGVRPALGRAFL